MEGKPRILIVDDYRTMSRIILNLLRQIGFDQVEEASDGRTALDRLKRERFDLVIAEWNMQPMTGAELLRALRADPALEQLPVIMITAESSIGSVVLGEGARASGCIVKPFNAATLRTKIDAVLCA